MNYEEMSDFELSAAIIETMDGGLLSKPYPTTKSESNARVCCGGVHYMDFDISNWASIGPLIIKHEIDVVFPVEGVACGVCRIRGSKHSARFAVKDKAPRAAAICYLKMMESE